MLFNCCGVGRSCIERVWRVLPGTAGQREAGRQAALAARGWQVSLSPSPPSFHNHIFLVINFCLGSSRRCGHGHHNLVCLSGTSLDSPSRGGFLLPPSLFLAPADSCRTAFVCRGRTCHVDDVASLARVYTRDKIAGRLYAWPSLKCPGQRCRLLPLPPLPPSSRLPGTLHRHPLRRFIQALARARCPGGTQRGGGQSLGGQSLWGASSSFATLSPNP